MLINVFVAGMFVASFLTIAQINPGFTHIRWIALSYAFGLLTPLADVLVPLATGVPILTMLSFGGLFIASVLMAPALSLLYGRRPNWRIAGVLLAIGFLLRILIWDAPRDTLWYHFTYQIPFATAALLCALTVRRHGRGTGLDQASVVLFGVISLHFLLKAVAANWYGIGVLETDYVNTSYAVISHMGSGALLIAAGLLILINALQIVMMKDREEAVTDALTGLPNRRGLQNAFQRLDDLPGGLPGDRKGAVAILDLDSFKRINDNFGHDRGDDVLRQVARCLDRNKPDGAEVFRMGGEEFVLLMERHEAPLVQLSCETLRLAVSALSFPDLGQVTISIGATPIARSEDLSTAMSRADRNLYKAKRNGRNRCEFEPIDGGTSGLRAALRLVRPDAAMGGSKERKAAQP